MSMEEERRSILERKRHLLLLIAQYLSDHGLGNTVEILAKESSLLASTRREFALCDNIDLESMYLDYISHHQLKFGRMPKITKRLDGPNILAAATTPSDQPEAESSINTNETPSAPIQPFTFKKPYSTVPSVRRRQQQFQQRAHSNALRSDVQLANEKLNGLDKSLIVSQCLTGGGQHTIDDVEDVTLTSTEHFETLPLLRHHPHFSTEWSAMADQICRDIVDGCKLNAGWATVKGHAAAKEMLNESVLMPLQYPQLFGGGGGGDKLGLRPWKCILLHGPPGTGKTSLARALCKEAAGRATFFNVAASSMVSRWRGDSEKLARVLFDVAKYYAPSIVFIDEVEGLMSLRDCSSEHEASKRFKNELLMHLDGLDEMRNVFVLGSTNLPWNLDPAFLRRFERKLLLGLPEPNVRREIIIELMPQSIGWSDSDWSHLLAATDDFSGDDIRIAHKAAALNTVRQTIALGKVPSSDPVAKITISADEFRKSVGHIKPTTKSQLPKYEQWNTAYGCV